jgi:Ca2+-binding EF-hand superfamily protein
MSVTQKWRESSDRCRLKVIFKKYDVDKSRSLSEDELFVALMKAFGLKIQLVSIDNCKELIRGYMKKFDKNNDGVIQFDEFYEIYKAMKGELTEASETEVNDNIISEDSKLYEKLKPENRNYKLLLCCDGGGVRGLISATFLNCLEKELGCKLCDIFDLVAGTSTGSVIAGGIAGMGFSTHNVRKFYELDTLNRVMPKSITDRMLGVVQGESIYKLDGKVDVLEEYFGDKKVGDCLTDICIPVYNITKRTIETITKRKHKDVFLKDAVNASSCAPVYYPPWKIGDDWYIDGGVVANDPTMCALGEAISLWGEDTPIRILSIGTGLLYKKIDGEKAYQKKWGAIQWFNDGDFVNILLDSSAANLQAQDILGENYCRINDSLEPYHITEEIDDDSNTNFSNLIYMGEKLWELHKERVLEFFLGAQDADDSIDEDKVKNRNKKKESRRKTKNPQKEE